MSDEFDVIIAGNGVLAASVAFALSQRAPALRLALVGPRTRSGCASLAAGAMLNVFGEVEEDGLSRPLQRYKFALAREALAEWPSWYRAIGEAAGDGGAANIGSGTYVLRAEGLDRNYAAIRLALEDAREAYEIVDPASIMGYRPAPSAKAAEAILMPAEGWLNPRRLFSMFERIFATRAGIVSIDASVTAIGVDGATKSARLSTGRILAAPKILIAAGAASGGLAAGIPELGGRVQPLFFGLGVALLFRLARPAPRAVLRIDHPGFDHGIHLVPQGGEEGDEVYVGSSSDIASGPDETDMRFIRASELRAAARESFTSDLTDAGHMLVGYRPVTADTFPLIGETSVPGLYLLTGTKRDGLHLSPVYARDMVERILSGKGFIEHFAPERKIIRWLSKSEGLALAGRRRRGSELAEEAYRRSGVDYGIPPELLGMYFEGRITAEQ